MKRLIVIFLSNLFLFSPALAMTVEEAYRAIPHKQTTFDPLSVRMNKEQANFLEGFFKLVDLAVVERVQTLIRFQTDGGRGVPFQHYQVQINNLLFQFRAMRVPTRQLENIHKLVIEAIEEQRGYFEMWHEAIDQGKPFKFKLTDSGPRHPLITSSHKKLIQSYNQLMRLFPKENQHNRQAFFDHLCALDFI